MRILPQLEHNLLRASERRLSTKPTPRGWWRKRGVALSLTLTAVALVGAGGGELLLASGKPVPPAFVLPASPMVGMGQPLAASLAPLPMRVTDPAGGLPWGMRVIRTTRGLVCLQAGRVLNGRLGALGIGYAFKADGRFHPFYAADAISQDSCPTVDRNGRAFQPGSATVVSADGLPLAGENIYPYQRVHCDLPGQEDWGVRCPEADLREVAVGLLGPDAASIRVTTPDRDFTVTPYGPDGAYLIVLPAPPGANRGPYGFPGRRAPGTPVLGVTYRDGSHCQIPANEPKQECSPKGLDYSPGPLPTATQLKTTIHVLYQPLMSHANGPLSAIGPSGQGLIPPSNKTGPGLVITFIATVSAPNISSAYDVELQPRPVQDCVTPEKIIAQPTRQTIASGQRVRITIPLQRCRTTYLGRVFFIRTSGNHGEARTTSRNGEGPLYEVIGGRTGRSGHSPELGVTVGHFNISVP